MTTTNSRIELHSCEPSPPERTTSLLHRVFGADSGPIRQLNWYTPRSDDPAFVHCHAWVAAPPGQPSAQPLSVGGTATNRTVALAKAIGEAVERYCGSVYDADRVQVMSHREAKGEAIDPRRFVLFHDSQYEAGFGINRVDEDSPIGWTRGYSLTNDRPVWVPASMVYTEYQALTVQEPFEVTPVSGYACGNTLEEALLGGICEVVERDAFMIHWYQRLPTDGIDLRTLQSAQAKETLERYRNCPVRLFCANITTDLGIPAVAALMTSQHPGWPAAAIATAASTDPERAVVRALQELSSNHLYVRDSADARAGDIPHGPEQVTSQEDHGLLYTHPRWLTQLDSLLRPRSRISIGDVPGREFSDMKDAVEHCVANLHEAGHEVLFADLTTPELAEQGFKVVKVLIPGLQPVDFGPHYRHLGGRRLYEVPGRLGHDHVGRCPPELNSFPHPFP
ncbi:MAG: YcaO-like family protein [Deltaproteobacteria bacterium]|nr:YcaO-like family protein [Deltaproteobacteria bacterium]